MKKTTKKNCFVALLVALMIAAIGIAGCTSTTDQTASPTSIPSLDTPEKVSSATPESTGAGSEPETVKETNIDTGVTKTIITTSEDGMVSKITLNRVTKTATAEINPFYIETPDEGFTDNSVEYVDEFIIPIAVGVVQFALFDPEGFEEWQKEGKDSGFFLEDGTEVEEENPLDGYKVTKLTMKFFEKDSNIPISDYVITGPTESEIVVTKHR